MTRIMKAGEFKAKCLELMDQVAETGEPVIITKRGKPVAQLGPVTTRRKSILGFYEGKIQIIGDIIAPIDVEWEADKP